MGFTLTDYQYFSKSFVFYWMSVLILTDLLILKVTLTSSLMVI
jgi:hypothetical protein